MAEQDEFIFSGEPAPEFFPLDVRGEFYREVASVWQLPVGARVCVLLRDHDLSEVIGNLELEHAPDLPLNARIPLSLSVDGVSFLSTHILSWSVAG